MTSPTVSVARCRPLLGTLVAVRVEGRDRRMLERALSAAFAAVETVHALMSVHDPDSELSRLNRSAVAAPLRVTEHTWRVLQTAARISRASAGRFDVTVAPTLRRWGYLPDAAVPVRRSSARWWDVRLEAGRQVRFARPLALDLGGIAKGYAVDLALEAAERHGAAFACVNAGGDIGVRGQGAERVWVRHPHAGALIDVGTLADGAIATSSAAASRRRREGRWVTPHVDPRSGRAGAAFAAVSVRAPSCMLADALTKVVLAGGDAAALLGAFAAQALVVAHDGSLRGTAGWRTRCGSA